MDDVLKRVEMGELPSGETEELSAAWKVMENLYKVSEEKSGLADDIGDLWDEYNTYGEDGDARPFFNALKSARNVPASSFILVYLAAQSRYPKNEEDLAKLRTYAEQYAKGADTANMEGRDIFENLEGMVQSKMFYTPIWDKINNNWKEYYRKCIFRPDFEHLRDIAFCYQMDIGDFQQMLQKALRRSRLNSFNRDELLTYVVIKFGDYIMDGTKDRFDLYDTLDKLYPIRNVQKNLSESYEGIAPNDLRTGTVQDRVEDFFAALNKEELFKCHSEEFHELLDWIEAQNQEGSLKRSVQLEYENQLSLLQEKLKSELGSLYTEDILFPDLEAQDMSGKTDAMDICEQKITIKYNSAKEVTLRAGLRISADTNIKRGAVKAEMVLAEDTVLSADTTRKTIMVPVTPITKSGNPGKIKFVKSEHAKNGFSVDYRPSGSPQYRVVADAPLNKYDLQVSPGEKLHFVKGPKESNGRLIITCASGAKILKGTVFGFEYKGNRFQYEVSDTVIADDFMTADLVPAWKNKPELWEKKNAGKTKYSSQVTVIDSHSIFNIDINHNDFPGLKLLSAENKKPVSISDPQKSAGEGRKSNANFYRLRMYLYGKDTYKGLTSYGKEYILNQDFFKSSMVLSKAFPKDELNRRNKLLTLIFLNFTYDGGHNLEYGYGYGSSRSEAVINAFTDECNEILDRCGLQCLYSGNVYDEFLRRLLVSDDPFAMYRTLFSSEHKMTEYLNVEVPAACGDWSWEVTRHLNDGTTESWGRGDEKAGNCTITMPRLIVGGTDKYTIDIRFKNEAMPVRRDIEINEEQEANILV